MSDTSLCLFPNLGAEEGSDWSGYLRQPSVRVAARLWSHLFAASTRFLAPDPTAREETLATMSCADLWPAELGPIPEQAVFDWLPTENASLAWYPTPELRESISSRGMGPLLAPDQSIVDRVHDKAFAVEAASAADWTPPEIASQIEVLSPEALADPDRLIARLQSSLDAWPDWLEGRFTLKPRLGSSGRGRVGGQHRVDTKALRGALPRLAKSGGALFEPWLTRLCDLSVVMRVPSPNENGALPTLLGSLEIETSTSGGYRGHSGEIDSRGRVFSGHREDERLRAAGAELAGTAAGTGFFGPCGLDAFVYRRPVPSESAPLGPEEAAGTQLRPVVEFNARATMGLVAIGLVRRALPIVRAGLDLNPGDRRAFFLALLPSEAPEAHESIVADAGPGASCLPLATEHEAGAPLPALFFARDLDRLQRAVRSATTTERTATLER